jgi:hypothetical protein
VSKSLLRLSRIAVIVAAGLIIAANAQADSLGFEPGTSEIISAGYQPTKPIIRDHRTDKTPWTPRICRYYCPPRY